MSQCAVLSAAGSEGWAWTGAEQLPGLYTASMRQLSDCQGYPRPLSPALSFRGCSLGFRMVACHGEDTFVDFFMQIYKEDNKILQLKQKRPKQSQPTRGGGDGGGATILSNDNKKARLG